MKEWTKEEIERLVPEARHQFEEKWLIGKLEIAPSATIFNLLLTTRLDLESARKDRDELRAELTLIADQDDIEMVLDPTWSKRIAIHAISRIEQSNKEQEQRPNAKEICDQCGCLIIDGKCWCDGKEREHG